LEDRQPRSFKVRFSLGERNFEVDASNMFNSNRDSRLGDEIVVLVNPENPKECTLPPYWGVGSG
jgi:hypothetical protein